MNKKYFEQFLQSAKVKAVEKVDLEKDKITYSSKIVQHQEIEKLRGDEEYVRAIIMTKLVNNYGYKLEKLEIEERTKVGTPLTAKPRADLIVKDAKGDVFLFIEFKSPDKYEQNQEQIIADQLFNLAALASADKDYAIRYLVLATCDLDRDDFPIKAIVIDRDQYPTYNSWRYERNYADEIPAHYGLAIKEPYVKGGNKDLDKEFTKGQIDDIRSNLHNVLWGGGSISDNEIFNSLVNLILAKIQDEGERKEGEEYHFQIKSFVKKSVKFETDQELYERINNLYRRALNRRMHITDNEELESAFVIKRDKFPLAKLKYVVSVFERYSFIDGKNSINGKDILGDFFEGIIRNGFKQSKGQFFTHTNIVKFIIWGLQLDKLTIDKVNNELMFPYVIDPSAGSGTFLVEYMKFVTDCVKRRFRNQLSNTRDVEDFFERWFNTPNRENRWAEQYIYGIESNPDLATASKVNMLLHGDGSSNIFAKDGLLPFSEYKKVTKDPNALNNEEVDALYYSKTINGQFDVVISNPPFSVTLDDDTKDERENGFLFSGKNSSENLFIERYYQLLRENGRLGLVLPECLFDTVDNRYIRLFIFKYFKIKAVVSLPSLAFEPFTSTKTSLLFAQKKTQKEIEQWDSLWKKYSLEYSNLVTRCKNIFDVIIKGKDSKRLKSISNLSDEEMKELIIDLINKYIKHDDWNLDLKSLITKYKDEIEEMNKYDNDCSEVYGMVNNFWVFSKVAQQLDYDIFMADVQEIGYKRTTRTVKERKNELFRQNELGSILVDDGLEVTVLDMLRKISWD